jgi:translation machinery-associated protein 16
MYVADLPDLEDDANVQALDQWMGDWTALVNIKFVRLSRNGERRTSSFPPKGAA